MPDRMETSLANSWKRNFMLALIANACSSVSFQMLIPALPFYVVDIIGQTESMAGLVVGILTFATILARPFSGKAIDLFNHRKLGVLGMLLCAVTIFCYQFAPHTILLIALRLIHGVGWAIVTGTTITIASLSIPKERLGAGMGLYGISSVVALAISPGLALLIIDTFPFQVLFGTASLLAGIGSVLLYFVQDHSPVFFQKRVGERGNWKNLFSGLIIRQAIKPSLINFCVSQTLSVILTFAPLYAAQYEIKKMGLFFAVYATALLFSRLLTGRLIDTKGFPVVIFPGLLLVMASIGLLSVARTLPVFLMAAVLYGFGYGFIHPSLQAMVAARSLPEERGAANSTLLLSSDLGFGLGAVLFGFLADVLGFRYLFPLLFVPVIGAVLIHFFYTSRPKNRPMDQV